ncbi:SDR family oxidoreductase [Colwellia psychrerythraea]|uniref:TrkA-N domain protein n=1 Tax=Colwellia psychrerythraea TaxID=28229 RepID=A0A099KD05_COLPS|nr:SDR family oxidoreductase [Colwellia psychrerythraea]KGJ87922.1 TrkA-N domain protein [Colwellia psychrerythraea]
MKNKVNLLLGSSVGIVGCGWLGTALAHQLKKQNIEVLATRSNAENVEQLKSEGLTAEVLCLPTEQTLLNKHPIFNRQCLVIAITPQFRQGRVDYAQKVQQLVAAAKASNCVEKIILLSSSAVYNGLSGLVDENIKLDLSADKVSLLSQAEQAVLLFNEHRYGKQSFNESNDGLVNRNGYVLRLSGLVGPNRHPGKFLLNGRMLKSPQAIVNLIHQQDAVGLIQAILTSNLVGGIFNGVSSTQVTKKQYYQAAATALQLPAPVFEEDEMLSGDEPKIVSGSKTKAVLNYHFVYADLLKWLDQGN